MDLNFDVVLAQAVARITPEVKEEVREKVLKSLEVKGFKVTEEELEDIVDAESIRQAGVGQFMREHIAQLCDVRKKAIKKALEEGKLLSTVMICGGMIEYMQLFKQRGYTTRAIELAIGCVSDTSVTRYTRGVEVAKQGKLRGQVIELLHSFDDFNLAEYRKCSGKPESYSNSCNNSKYSIEEIETIQRMTLQGYSADEIAEEINRSTSTIIQYMKKAFPSTETLQMLRKCYGYTYNGRKGRHLLKQRGLAWMIEYYRSDVECGNYISQEYIFAV